MGNTRKFILIDEGDGKTEVLTYAELKQKIAKWSKFDSEDIRELSEDIAEKEVRLFEVKDEIRLHVEHKVTAKID